MYVVAFCEDFGFRESTAKACVLTGIATLDAAECSSRWARFPVRRAEMGHYIPFCAEMPAEVLDFANLSSGNVTRSRLNSDPPHGVSQFTFAIPRLPMGCLFSVARSGIFAVFRRGAGFFHFGMNCRPQS